MTVFDDDDTGLLAAYSGGVCLRRRARRYAVRDSHHGPSRPRHCVYHGGRPRLEGSYLDNLRFESYSVPEPHMLALLGAEFVLLLGFRLFPLR
jgi:hypothetical protein